MDTTQQPYYTVLEKKATTGGFGGPGYEYIEVGTIQGYMDMLTGQETMDTNTELAKSTHVLLTNWTDTIKRHMVIKDSEGKMFEITYIDDPVSLRHHLEIYLSYMGV